MQLEFEWDEAKNLINIAKHRVNFANIRSVFNDPFKLNYVDYNHNYNEARWNCIGYDKNGILFFVVYTYRDETIRIISARHATSRERRIYGNS